MPACACCSVSAGPWHWPQLAASTFSAAALARAAGSFASGLAAAGVPGVLATGGVLIAAAQPASSGLSAHVSCCGGLTSVGAGVLFVPVVSGLLSLEFPQASAKQMLMPELNKPIVG